MAVELNIVSNNNYIGILKATATTANGVFVVPDYSAGTAAIADATTGDGNVLLTNNVNTNIDEQGVADADFTTAADEYLRLKQPQVGDVITTDQFAGTPAVAAELAVGVDGKLEAIGVRTPRVKFEVIDASASLNGNNAIKVLVTQV